MKNIITVMKKEFARFFKDKRMVLMTLLPAILIYVLYSFMGTAMRSMFSPDKEYVPIAHAVNMPDAIREKVKSAGISIVETGVGEVDAIK